MRQMNLWFYDRNLEKYDHEPSKVSRMAYSFNGLVLASASLLVLINVASAYVNQPMVDRKKAKDIRIHTASSLDPEFWLGRLVDVEKVGEVQDVADSIDIS